MAKAIGAAIQALREAKHMSASELARRARVTRQHLGRIERGECGASDAVIDSIADGLQVPAAAISYEVAEPAGATR
jgi:transcriptional regulator with XRE-family HTH domain